MSDATSPVEPGLDTAPASEVDRSVEIDAPVDHVWRTLTDPDELAAWLDADVAVELEPGAVGRVVEPDGTVRQMLVTEVDPGHRLAWHWWEDGGELSTVEITTDPILVGDGEATRVRVVETLAAGPGSLRAQAGTAGGAHGRRWDRMLTTMPCCVRAVTVQATASPALATAGSMLAR